MVIKVDVAMDLVHELLLVGEIVEPERFTLEMAEEAFHTGIIMTIPFS